MDKRIEVMVNFFLEEKFGVDLVWMLEEPLYRTVLATHREVYVRRARVLLARLEAVEAK